jgi:hypothetical protein
LFLQTRGYTSPGSGRGRKSFSPGSIDSYARRGQLRKSSRAVSCCLLGLRIARTQNGNPPAQARDAPGYREEYFDAVNRADSADIAVGRWRLLRWRPIRRWRIGRTHPPYPDCSVIDRPTVGVKQLLRSRTLARQPQARSAADRSSKFRCFASSGLAHENSANLGERVG